MKNNKGVGLKELFERVVQLETKMDMKTENDKIVAKRFKGFIYVIIGIQIINLIFSYFIYVK